MSERPIGDAMHNATHLSLSVPMFFLALSILLPNELERGQQVLSGGKEKAG